MSGCCDAAIKKNCSDRIRPYAKNPYYWQYKGEPVLLLGGGKTDHIFLAEGLEQHLDEIAEVGGNYVRNTMSQREGLDLKPHLRLPDGKFDLNQWNPEYWKRFANCLKWCSERNIIIQIEIWDRFDYSNDARWDSWQSSPWRPGSNINYTNEQSGLAEDYMLHPSKDKQPFFHTVPGTEHYQKRYDIIRHYQEHFVDKMLSYSLKYGNVLYCMNNETSTSPKWGQFWMSHIRQKAADAGVDVYVTDMFDVGWELDKEAKFLLSFDRPDLYTFLDISQNNAMYNSVQGHWSNIQFVRRCIAEHPRPVNNTKVYGSDDFKRSAYHLKAEKRFGTAAGVQSFWMNVFGGCASTRFHRSPGGNGLTDIAKQNIRSVRLLTSELDIFRCTPDSEFKLLTNRDDNEAYLTYIAGKQYTVYFPNAGSVELDLSDVTGTFTMKWLDIASCKWTERKIIKGGHKVTLKTPGKDSWAVIIQRN